MEEFPRMQWYDLGLVTQESGLENFHRKKGALGATQISSSGQQEQATILERLKSRCCL